MSKSHSQKSPMIESTVFYWPSQSNPIAKNQMSENPFRQAKPVFGISEDQPHQAVKKLESGFPYSVFEQVRKEFKATSKEMAAILNISSRTINRRKQEGRFSPDESERIYRIGRVFNKASIIFSNKENVRLWLNTPLRALGDNTPLEFCKTEIGAREVENVLGRIEHGVFS